MLISLAIRDVVLIDRLDLDFRDGLCVLTGETGAGKSILLDALGLALGARGDSTLVRPNGQAAVTAIFALEQPHPVFDLLADYGLEPPASGEQLILRRILSTDGRSRAFANDQPIGIALLREIGESLVEIEGQFASRSLLNTATHRTHLDAFGRLEQQSTGVIAAFGNLRVAIEAVSVAREALSSARADEDYLRHVVGELDALDPQPGEEADLAGRRILLMNRSKLAEALQDARQVLDKDDGIDSQIGQASRLLTRHADDAGGLFDDVINTLDRAASEAGEARALLEKAAADIDTDPARLDELEERLFALRAAARKHQCDVDSLPALRTELAARLTAIDGSTQHIDGLERELAAAREGFLHRAERLSVARRKAAKALDAAVTKELPPLKLEKARFRAIIERVDETDWNESGIDRVTFEVATNPGQPPGPIARIASGGELARFMLALKVVLSGAEAVPTLVFDEVDAGISGAAAAAVGDRLQRLGNDVQVLVVTHSPQVAARGAAHWRVVKSETKRETVTRVDVLDETDRREEIARMLAGARITDEARAAAARLLEGQRV